MEKSELILREMFAAALTAVDPRRVTAGHGERLRTKFREGGFSRLLVIACGKAALPMALAIEDTMGDLIGDGLVVTSYGNRQGRLPQRMRVIEAAHPVPDDNGVRGTQEIMAMAQGADEGTMTLVLLSGGGSALLVAPAEGITLAQKRETTTLLLRAGAAIDETNAVRKHLSKVKGGRLAELLHPSTVVSLLLSDVIGDRLDVIASGPTAPDPSTFGDAMAVLKKYGLADRAPKAVLERLEKGSKGDVAETPKEGSRIFDRVENQVIGGNLIALDAAVAAADKEGIMAEILTAKIFGEASIAGRRLAVKSLTRKLHKGDHAPPLCLLSGGETTVTVRGKGQGGRNLELALAFALEIEGTPGITLLSAGTDGIDGPTDAAGAIVDGLTAIRARKLGLDPESFLRNNDSYNFFRRAGGLLVTGPTGTNVMDLQLIHIA